MQVRLKEHTDQAWVESVLRRCWGGSDIVVRGCVYKAADLPALIAGTQDGLCTFAIESDGISAELVTMNALVPAKGIGTALIGALISHIAANGVRSLRVSTTNDNVNAWILSETGVSNRRRPPRCSRPRTQDQTVNPTRRIPRD